MLLIKSGILVSVSCRCRKNLGYSSHVTTYCKWTYLCCYLLTIWPQTCHGQPCPRCQSGGRGWRTSCHTPPWHCPWGSGTRWGTDACPHGAAATGSFNGVHYLCVELGSSNIRSTLVKFKLSYKYFSLVWQWFFQCVSWNFYINISV